MRLHSGTLDNSVNGSEIDPHLVYYSMRAICSGAIVALCLTPSNVVFISTFKKAMLVALR